MGYQYGHARLWRTRRHPVDWVAGSGKNVTTIYVTHAHGDHFFGLKLLLHRFPNARAFATASSVAGMQNQIKPDSIKSFREPRFPGQVPQHLVTPEILKGDTLYLEGDSRSYSRFQPGRGEHIDRDGSLSENAGVAPEPSESRLTLGNCESTKPKARVGHQ